MTSEHNRTGIAVAAGLGGWLAFVFLLQWLLGEHGPRLTLTPEALLSQGALDRHWVMEGGDWYRLASSVVLHARVMEAVAMVLAVAAAGYVVGRALGWGWAASAFVLTALAGSASALLFGGDVPSTGAAGGALGLVAVGLAGWLGHPAGAEGRAPAGLWVLATFPTLHGILDQASRTPAFLVGSAAVAAVLALLAWRRSVPPRFVRVTALACAALLLLGTGVAFARRPAIARNLALNAALAPDTALDRLRILPMDQKGPALQALAASHPRDPRVRHYLGLLSEEQDELSEAADHLTRGLAEREVLEKFFPDRKLEGSMRTALARIQAAQGDEAAARRTLEPACTVLTEPPRSLPAGLFQAACGKR